MNNLFTLAKYVTWTPFALSDATGFIPPKHQRFRFAQGERSLMSSRVQGSLFARVTALLMLPMVLMVLMVLMSMLLASVAQATTFTVINTNDAGAGSLRQAITDSNANNSATDALPHNILFAIAGGGVKTIAPTTQYPFITRPVVIDGYSQPGSSANSLAVGNNSVHQIELDGTNANIGNACFFFSPGSGGSVLRGMVVNRCAVFAVVANTGNIRLEGNFLGTNAAGDTSLGRGTVSLGNLPFPDRGSVIIGGSLPAQRNVIAGNSTGIVVDNRDGVIITGNYIGTNAAGTAALGGQGINIGSLGGAAIGPYLIGGITATPGTGAGNVISGGEGNGITVNASRFSTAIDVGAIQGNLIGLSANGGAALGNAGVGIRLNDQDFSDGLTPKISPVSIGGTAAGSGNVISGNRAIAISATAGAVTIQRNFIGTDITGNTALPNAGGIALEAGFLFSASTTFIGGRDAGNVISGNFGGNAIVIKNLTAVIKGNLIGTGADGVTTLGNTGRGIDVVGAVAIIGGTALGEGNTITGSRDEGIRVVFDAVTNVGKATILGNSIYQNGAASGSAGGLGINLYPPQGDQVTPNDVGDADIGASGLQNYPVIVSATAAGNVQGTLNSTASTTFRVEFFANAACDGSGFGEGQTFIGFRSVTTDGSGNASFNAAFAPLPPGQQVVTSTATDPAGNTSEFSACQSTVVAALPTLSINNVTLAEGNSGTTAFNFTVTLSAASAPAVTVNFATSNGTATAGSDYVATSGTLTFAPGVLTQTITVNVNGDTTVEPDEAFLVTLSAPVNATIAIAQGTGTIVNDDAAVVLPTLSINNVLQNEGNSGLTQFVFTVTLSAASATPVTVNYATSDASATAGSDYNAASGVLTFAPGVLTQTITVNVIGDTVIESTETFVLTLSAPVNATIATAQGIGTIVNDDAAPVAASVVVPTLGDWALMALSLMLMLASFAAMRRSGDAPRHRNDSARANGRLS